MHDHYQCQIVKYTETVKISAVAHFLLENNLTIDTHVTTFVVICDDEHIVVCGGIDGNILKCIAIDQTRRGEGLALRLLTELIRLAYESGQSQLFLFTKPENESLFFGAGFYPLITVPQQLTLMENSQNRLQYYCQTLSKNRHEGQKIAAIVMNANSLTLGHRYLIEQAVSQCDWLHLFVVKEDLSRFRYTDRFNMIRVGTADISRPDGRLSHCVISKSGLLPLLFSEI